MSGRVPYGDYVKKCQELEQANKCIAELESGLEKVCKHMEFSVPTGYKMCAAWIIARRALVNNNNNEG